MLAKGSEYPEYYVFPTSELSELRLNQSSMKTLCAIADLLILLDKSIGQRDKKTSQALNSCAVQIIELVLSISNNPEEPNQNLIELANCNIDRRKP